MSPFDAGVERRVVWRSLWIQGSWNYETLIGTGFAFTMIPALRHLFPADEPGYQRALARQAEVFNSHPYLATVAVGAIARLEADRVDPRVISRFKSALRGSLGSLGDQLVWRAWRPASALLGIVLLLLGAAWWASVAAFLVVYNTLNLGLRIWGWRTGSRAGLEVGRVLKGAPIQRLATRAAQVGAVLAGAGIVLSVPAGPAPVIDILLPAAAIAAGVWLGPRARTVLAAGLIILVCIGIALEILP